MKKEKSENSASSNQLANLRQLALLVVLFRIVMNLYHRAIRVLLIEVRLMADFELVFALVFAKK